VWIPEFSKEAQFTLGFDIKTRTWKSMKIDDIENLIQRILISNYHLRVIWTSLNGT